MNLPSIWRRLRIRTKIILPFVLLFSVIIFGMLALTIFLFDRKYDQQFSAETQQWLETIQHTQYIEEPEKVKQAYHCEVIVFGGDDTLNGSTLVDLPDPEWSALGKYFALSQVRTKLSQQNTPVIGNVRLAGRPYKVVYAKQSLNRIYCLMRPMGRVAQAKRQTLQITAVIAFIGLLLVVLISTLIGRNLIRPIDQLVQFTHRVASGDLEHQCDIIGIDEVGQLTAAFNQMTQDLRRSRKERLQAERLTTAGQLSAAFAHEIRNPLSSIKMLTQMMVGKMAESTAKQSLTRVLDEIERIEVIVSGLMNFARPTELNRINANLNAIAESVLKLMEVNLKHHQISIVTHFDASLAHIQVDTDKMKQILMNLILNAIQSMPEGGELTITTQGFSDQIRLQVEDTGIGIPVETIDRIFDPFFTTKPTGTGLGLPTSRRLVEQHQGLIVVDSVEGQGTTVIVELPRHSNNNSG